jgi:UDP-GlcNAc:undecaprenyl-phosphate GlcNAc-1-phosphate transferase
LLVSVGVYFAVPAMAVTDAKLIWALVGATGLGFVIGLIDDSYNTPPRFKFIGQVGCTLIMLLAGLYIPISGYYGLDALFTLVWVVGVMNAINMIDNMDGISTIVSIGIISCLLFIAFTQPVADATFYAVSLVGVLGALLGFLYFNYNPAKIYMGDAGSQFLGAFLAFMSIGLMWSFKGNTAYSFSFIEPFLVPAIAFILPIIDTTTVCIRRVRRGQSPFVGGRDHTTHHLVYFGLSDKQVSWVFMALSILSVGLVALMLQAFSAWYFVYSLGVILYFGMVFFAMQWVYGKGRVRLVASQQKEDNSVITTTVSQPNGATSNDQTDEKLVGERS